MISAFEKYAASDPRVAQEKISNCYAILRNRWVYLSAYHGGRGVFEVIDVDEQGSEERSLEDLSAINYADLKFGPYPLGYIHFKKSREIVYVSREPVRKNKFGLRSDNISFTKFGQIEPIKNNRGEDGVNYWNRLWGGEILQLFRNKRDPLEVAFKALQDEGQAVFSADFAGKQVTRRVASIYHRLSVTGEMDLKDGVVSLYPSYGHLLEKATDVFKKVVVQ